MYHKGCTIQLIMYRLLVVPIPPKASQLHKHVRRFKHAKNDEIGVLLELPSHELYSQKEIQMIRSIVSVECKSHYIFTYGNQYLLLNDIVPSRCLPWAIIKSEKKERQLGLNT